MAKTLYVASGSSGLLKNVCVKEPFASGVITFASAPQLVSTTTMLHDGKTLTVTLWAGSKPLPVTVYASPAVMADGLIVTIGAGAATATAGIAAGTHDNVRTQAIASRCQIFLAKLTPFAPVMLVSDPPRN